MAGQTLKQALAYVTVTFFLVQFLTLERLLNHVLQDGSGGILRHDSADEISMYLP